MDSRIRFISLLSPYLATLLFQVSVRTHGAYATSAGLLHLSALSPESHQSMDNFVSSQPDVSPYLSLGDSLLFYFLVNSLPF